ncbi:MAG: DUF3754 domain-containing protein [Sulfurovum sp.]
MKINYNNDIKERFIPIAYDELLSSSLSYLNIDDNMEYKKIWKSIHKHYYYKFYDEINSLKREYQPFNPDSDIVSSIEITPDEYIQKEKKLFEHIRPLLNHANYEILTHQMLEDTMNKTSPYGVDVSVDFNDYEKIELYYRGESVQIDEIRDPKKLYMKKKLITEPIYRRLFLIIKPKLLSDRAKEIANESGKDIEAIIKKLKKQNPLLSQDNSNHNIYIKLFKNIPQMDLQMLFPNTKVKMRLFDKIKISVLGGGGTIGGGSTLIAKLGAAAIEPMSALLALGAFAGILWRQVKEVMFRRTHYMAQLAKNLYFHSLDNNAGALNYMINMAEEEESKEVFLVYIFLSQEATPITIESLDKKIEVYVKRSYNIEMDFEVDDGLVKLRELNLLIQDGNMVSVIEPKYAMEKLG